MRLKPGDLLSLDDYYFIRERLIACGIPNRLRIIKISATSDETSYKIDINVPDVPDYQHVLINTKTATNQIVHIETKSTNGWDY